jgi:hypothetical protein
MKLNAFSDKIHAFIRTGRMKEAIDAMLAFLEQTPYLVEVLAQSGRYAELKRQEHLGIVHFDYATIERNKIRVALLELLDEIREKMEIDERVQKEVNSANFKKIFKYALPIIPLWFFKGLLFTGVIASAIAAKKPIETIFKRNITDTPQLPNPKPAPNSKPQGASNRNPEGASNSKPNGAANSKPEGAANSKPEGVPQSEPEVPTVDTEKTKESVPTLQNPHTPDSVVSAAEIPNNNQKEDSITIKTDKTGVTDQPCKITVRPITSFYKRPNEDYLRPSGIHQQYSVKRTVQLDKNRKAYCIEPNNDGTEVWVNRDDFLSFTPECYD